MQSETIENRGRTLRLLFWSFFKIGIFTFGGGYAMIPLMQREVVDRRGWVARDRFLELLTLAQSAPGPISLNTAVFVGYNLGRLPGAVLGLLGVVLPSFIVILLVALYFSGIRHNKVFEAAFTGMRPAVVALIAAPIFGLAKGMGVWRLVIAGVAAVLLWRLHLSPIWFIIAGAAGGILWLKTLGGRAAATGGRKEPEEPAEDSEPRPPVPEYPFETPGGETFKLPDE
ncbi:MAG: chromate transporter [Alistipes sp.]|nr:chromate transporter [Alistipes sp.]